MLSAPEFGFDEAYIAEFNRLTTDLTLGVPGLSESRLTEIEAEWEFRFPPDLRWLLGCSTGVLYRWNPSEREHMRKRLDWPLWGMLFAVGRNDFWMARWGDRPADEDARSRIVRRDFQSWPRLIPIYSHRFIAAEPSRPGNPVYSVYQTDIIFYGSNLADYLRNEFSGTRSSFGHDDVVKIEPWHTVIEMNSLPEEHGRIFRPGGPENA